MRLLVVVHRWLGVILCIPVLAWFASGVVLMYRGFPEVTRLDRLGRAAALDPSRVRLSATEAHAHMESAAPVESVTLTTVDGRPAYRIRESGGRGRIRVVYADDGSVHGDADAAMVDRAAAQWAGSPVSAATKESVDAPDQWTVGGRLRTLRPLYKYSFADGQNVYVDGRTAEVVQYTTTSSRLWAYLGAIPHWFYFTPLRSHPGTWSSVVIWSSLAATVAAIVGIAIAVSTFSPRRRYRISGRSRAVPYREMKRWHAVTGLACGAVTVTWAFSGLLSMGPFPVANRLANVVVFGGTAAATTGDAGIAAALRGSDEVPVAMYEARHPSAAIEALGAFEVRDLDYRTFRGEPVYVATNDRGDTRIVPVHGMPQPAFDTDAVVAVIRSAAGEAIRDVQIMHEYDAYYFDRAAARPLPVIVIRMDDEADSRHYVDPRTAEVVGSYDRSRWVDRWLYRGLHSIAFPGLYTSRPLWDVVTLTLLAGGTLLSATSIVLAWRVVARKVRGK